jgi:hypothetical protein
MNSLETPVTMGTEQKIVAQKAKEMNNTHLTKQLGRTQELAIGEQLQLLIKHPTNV